MGMINPLVRRISLNWAKVPSNLRVRQIVLQRGFRPWPSAKEWDGFRVIDAQESKSHVDESLRREILYLIAEGYYETRAE
jgi:hypothetical protein